MSKPKHENRVEFQVFGDFAQFSDPLTRVSGEKHTYPVPTYEALKGILKSVYWSPTLIWVIDAVRVMNPIKTEAIGVLWKQYSGGYERSYNVRLSDVRYFVRAHFEWNDNRPELAGDRIENKHHNMAKRAIKRGGRRAVFLGTSNCSCYVQPCDFDGGVGAYDDVPEMEFGLMSHGLTYPDEAYSPETHGKLTANFWYPVMKNGIITFLRPEDCPLHKPLRDMTMKLFEKGR